MESIAPYSSHLHCSLPKKTTIATFFISPQCIATSKSCTVKTYIHIELQRTFLTSDILTVLMFPEL